MRLAKGTLSVSQRCVTTHLGFDPCCGTKRWARPPRTSGSISVDLLWWTVTASDMPLAARQWRATAAIAGTISSDETRVAPARTCVWTGGDWDVDEELAVRSGAPASDETPRAAVRAPPSSPAGRNQSRCPERAHAAQGVTSARDGWHDRSSRCASCRRSSRSGNRGSCATADARTGVIGAARGEALLEASVEGERVSVAKVEGSHAKPLA